MKNIELQENTTVVGVTNQIFKVFEVLKYEGITSREYYFVLLFHIMLPFLLAIKMKE